MVASRGLLLSFLCAHCLLVSAQNETDEVVVDVQGHSGKFTVYKKSEGKANGIQINMDALRELDSEGNAVGTSGNTKHSINTFAAQDFTIARMETVTLAAGQLGDANAQGVSASKISFSSPVSSIGTVRIDTYIMKGAGSVGPPGETWTVQAGDMKWNIELSNWTWCGCSQGQKQQVGDMIDVDVTVKGLVDAARGRSNKSVNLGGGVAMELSNKVYVDGAWAAMPAGFPRVSFQGSSTTLTFRFPKFNTNATYDPAITGLSGSSSSANGWAMPSTPLWLVFSVAAVLASGM